MPSIFERAISWIEGQKAEPFTLPVTSPEDIRRDLQNTQTSAGQKVDRQTAMQVSVVTACARVIAEGLAQTSCRVMREDARGSLIEARDHPLFVLLNRKPNEHQTSFEFREQLGLHLAIHNNAFVYLNRVGDRIVELLAYPPECVKVEQADDFTLSYKIGLKKGQAVSVPASDMWHLRGPSWNGFSGLDFIDTAKRTIGLALATEQYGATFFTNQARPAGVLTTRPGGAPLSPEQRKQLKDAWSDGYQGTANAHKTALLPFDLQYEQIGVTANDAQWVESRKFLIEEVCRFFRVRPIMVMQQGATSYASVEQELLAHLTHTLMPWFERFEQSADVNLLTTTELDAGVCVKLNHNALLRGSTQERTSYYNAMVTLGVMTVNEVRQREDLPLSDEPDADKLRGAANLFGAKPATDPVTDNQNNNEVSE